jgi:hypothetical protein
MGNGAVVDAVDVVVIDDDNDDVSVVFVVGPDVPLRTSHKRMVLFPAVILQSVESDVGWKDAAITTPPPLILLLLFDGFVAAVLIVPTSLQGLLVIVVVVVASAVKSGGCNVGIVDEDDDKIIGFQSRIIESEHPTANKVPE